MLKYRWRYTVRYNGRKLTGTFRSTNARDRADAVRVLEDNYGKGCVVALTDARRTDA